MSRALRGLLSVVFTVLCGVLGVVIIIGTAPADTSIDEGWRLAWIGLGSGLLVGLAGVWWFWRRRRVR